jgi:hypothetical protein
MAQGESLVAYRHGSGIVGTFEDFHAPDREPAQFEELFRFRGTAGGAGHARNRIDGR